MNSIVKTLSRSIREYKKTSILTPLLVTVEVVLECAIPFVIANLVNQMQAGCSMDVIVRYGAVLLVMAVISLIFGGAAGARRHLRQRFRRLCPQPAQGYVLQDPGLFL